MLAAGPPVVGETEQTPSRPWHRKTTVIAALSVAAIVAHLALRFGFRASPASSQIPLLVTLAIGGVPLLYDLLRKLLKREFGSDLLGGISIITSVLLGEYLAGSIIVLLLAGVQQYRQRERERLHAGSLQHVVDRMKTWFTGNF